LWNASRPNGKKPFCWVSAMPLRRCRRRAAHRGLRQPQTGGAPSAART
jgi:hypothetical protein